MTARKSSSRTRTAASKSPSKSNAASRGRRVHKRAGDYNLEVGIPHELHVALVKLAQQEQRTLAGLVRVILTQAVEGGK